MGKKLLVVVDYQNDFVDGTLGFKGAELLDRGIAEKVRKYGRDTDGVVYYTLDTHYTYYLETREGKQLPVEHCIKETDGWQVYGETAYALEDVNAIRIQKETFGISPNIMTEFGLSRVNTLLPTEEVESIELVGLVTNMCLISNAVVFQARYPNAQIIIDASLCDSFDREMHEQALNVMESMQMKVINR